MKYKRYEYALIGSVEYCEDDVVENQSWDDLKSSLTEESVMETLQINDHFKYGTLKIVRIIEGHYEGYPKSGKEVIDKITEVQ